jgi:hypothetical protein
MVSDQVLEPALNIFSLEQLTENFSHFNKLLDELASEFGLRFFDANSTMSDQGLLCEEFRDYGHHYKNYLNPESDAKKAISAYFKKFFE